MTLTGTTIEEVQRYHRDTLQLAVKETNRQYRELRAKEDARLEEHRRRMKNASKSIKFD